MKHQMYRCTLLVFTLLSVFSCLSLAQNDSSTAVPKSDLGIIWILIEGGPTGDFYISSTEITFDQFDAFCDATGYQKPEDTYGRGKQPVVNVSVPDATAFCAWLSKKTGATIRFPLIEEWEFAATGGKKNDSNLFSGSDDPDDVAWFVENSDEKNHEVATKKPNELGIYDMSGNVWEMCPDSKYICGGSSQSIPQNCFTSASTEITNPNERSAIIGFRVVKEIKAP